MELTKLKESDKQDSTKYLLKEGEKELGFGYLIHRVLNPIEIYIHENYRSNGYGKSLFKVLLAEAKKQEIEKMIFNVNSTQIRFKNIISQAGAIELGRYNNITKYLLKII